MVEKPCRQFCLSLEGTDSYSRNRVYSVYNTLDYPIVIGKQFTDEYKDYRAIYWEPIQNYLVENEDGSTEVHPDVVEDLNRMDSLAQTARALRALVTNLLPVISIYQSEYKYEKSHMDRVDLLDDFIKRIGTIYPKYSAKDRFLVPMDVYVIYTNLVNQNIRVYESLICTNTCIPNYGRPPFQVREPEKNHSIHPPISLKRLNENGVFIFGQHEK